MQHNRPLVNNLTVMVFVFLACIPVWQKLEEENREFFMAYYLRLMVKQQIIEYNRLLEQQAQLMHQLHSTGVSSLPTSNGSHIPSSKNFFILDGIFLIFFLSQLLPCLHYWKLRFIAV